MISLDSHEFPRTSAPALERIRLGVEERSPHVPLEMLYDLVGADKADSFSFTSSGAEAINQVHWTAFLEIARKDGKCHFLTSPAEDIATLQSLKRLEQLGCYVKIVPFDSKGCIDLGKLSELLTPRTALISLSFAHGLTGVIQPIQEIVQMAHAAGVLVHVDATHALGKLYEPFRQSGVDYLTFGGGGIHSVKGSGAVFAKAGRPLVPLILGERSDTPSLLALTAAATHAGFFFDQMGLEVARLRDRLEEGVVGAKALFKDCFRLPNVSVLSFPKVHQESLHFSLMQKTVFASIGGSSLPHLHRHLLSCGFDEHTALTSCSFSLSRFTTQEEIDQAIQIINGTVKALLPLTEDLF
jgi:cysteine desulfurase